MISTVGKGGTLSEPTGCNDFWQLTIENDEKYAGADLGLFDGDGQSYLQFKTYYGRSDTSAASHHRAVTVRSFLKYAKMIGGQGSIEEPTICYRQPSVLFLDLKLIRQLSLTRLCFWISSVHVLGIII